MEETATEAATAADRSEASGDQKAQPVQSPLRRLQILPRASPGRGLDQVSLERLRRSPPLHAGALTATGAGAEDESAVN